MSQLEQALEQLKDFCEVITKNTAGYMIKAKKSLNHTQFINLHERIRALGGKYYPGQGIFLIAEQKQATTTTTGPREILTMVTLSKLLVVPFNPRLQMDPISMAELVESVKTHGVCDPIRVRPSHAEGMYDVVYGNRRWKAAEQAGLIEIPAIVSKMTDQEACETAFIENEQRKDLTDYERGRGIKILMSYFPETYTNQATVAKRLSISQSRVSYLVRHFEEIEKQKETMPSGIMTRVIMLPERVTHEIRRAPPKMQPKLLEVAAEAGLTVQQTKDMVDRLQLPDATPEEAMAAIQQETQGEYKAEESKRRALINKLGEIYPQSVLAETVERRGRMSERKLSAFLIVLIDIAWTKLKERGLLDEVYEEAGKWKS